MTIIVRPFKKHKELKKILQIKSIKKLSFKEIIDLSNKLYNKAYNSIDIINYLENSRLSHLNKEQKNTFLLCYHNICKKIKMAQKYKVKFEIVEELECDKVDNYYKEMIEDLYRICDNEDFKKIINIMIGKFSVDKTKIEKQKFIKCCNEDELKRRIDINDELLYYKITDEDYIIYTFTEELGNIFNKHPINIQIKDETDMLLFKTMIDLELNENGYEYIYLAIA